MQSFDSWIFFFATRGTGIPDHATWSLEEIIGTFDSTGEVGRYKVDKHDELEYQEYEAAHIAIPQYGAQNAKEHWDGEADAKKVTGSLTAE